MSRQGMSRREMLTTVAKTGGAIAVAPMINLGRFRPLVGSDREYSARAIRLVTETPVIDMLSPITLDFALMRKWFEDPSTFTDADLEPFKRSGIDVIHIAVGTGGPEAYDRTLGFISAWNSFLAGQPNRFMRIASPADLDAVHGSGRIGILLGIQNAQHFRTPDDVDTFFRLGQRVAQLTYNARTLIGDGATERTNCGISDFGVSIVRRMNEVGMAVDVSHCGDRTTMDAFEISGRPVLITHSNCRALVPGHPRTKPDEAIRAMARSGGVMGITSVRNFVKATEPTTIEDMLDHYEHVARLVGVEHVGVGSDIDLYGYDAMPPEDYQRLKDSYKGTYAFRDKIDIEGVDHPERMFDLTEGLIRRGYGDGDIEGILGGNFRRVLAEIWTVPAGSASSAPSGSEAFASPAQPTGSGAFASLARAGAGA